MMQIVMTPIYQFNLFSSSLTYSAGAGVINLITTPCMNEYTWHTDTPQINICPLEKTL